MLVYGGSVSTSVPVTPVTTTSLAAIRDRGVPVPTYDRSRLQPRIAHVGVGGFHRSHMALYVHELAESGSEWGIRGVGLLPGDERMRDALLAQDFMYTLTEKSNGSHEPQVIGSIIDYVLSADDQAAFDTVLADDETAILSLTITESGYAAPTSGASCTLDAIAAALDARRNTGGRPITILSCDNLPANGDVARGALLAAADRRSSALHAWISTNCTFPNSMVDRITPVTAEADHQWLLDNVGIDDRWPVVAEPFRQWVIQDQFAAGRPAWEHAGALFTDDVHAWELYKLRFLNAGHSCMAYLCSLAGITYVDEGVNNPVVHGYLSRLLYDEALPTLTPIAGHPREDYIRVVLERFANTAVRDQIARLCIDGTAKFPTFLIPTIVRQLELGGPIDRATLALAGWARYLALTPRDQQAFDAAGERPHQFAVAALADPSAFLELSEVFPLSLRDNARFRDTFAKSIHLLDEQGPLRAMMG